MAAVEAPLRAVLQQAGLEDFCHRFEEEALTELALLKSIGDDGWDEAAEELQLPKAGADRLRNLLWVTTNSGVHLRRSAAFSSCADPRANASCADPDGVEERRRDVANCGSAECQLEVESASDDSDDVQLESNCEEPRKVCEATAGRTEQEAQDIAAAAASDDDSDDDDFDVALELNEAQACSTMNASRHEKPSAQLQVQPQLSTPSTATLPTSTSGTPQEAAREAAVGEDIDVAPSTTKAAAATAAAAATTAAAGSRAPVSETAACSAAATASALSSAECHKSDGNAALKAGKLVEAIRCYTLAIERVGAKASSAD
eukprot:60902-Pleurochrysis_carterae.AAC.3